MQDDVLNLLRSYLDKYPQEKSRTQPIFDALDNGLDICDRKNMTGHLTASALVYDKTDKTFLMLEHKALKKWLAPGGHVDAGEMPEISMFRELKEETSISDKPQSCELIDIDCHKIPPRPEKEEDEHYHFDFRYLLTYGDKPSVELEENESLNYAWVNLTDISNAYPEIQEKLSA